MNACTHALGALDKAIAAVSDEPNRTARDLDMIRNAGSAFRKALTCLAASMSASHDDATQQSKMNRVRRVRDGAENANDDEATGTVAEQRGSVERQRGALGAIASI